MLTSNSPDVLIVGLGNPGERYLKTRHNIGWMVIDDLFSSGGWSAWNFSGKGLVTAGTLFGVSAMMLKPMTMMNSSGEAVIAVTSQFPIEASRIIVVHDELDIPFAEIRSKCGGGTGGHRGVLSVNEQLKTPDFHRVRCGIGRPANGVAVIDHVLTSFSLTEAESIPGIVVGAIQSVQEIVSSFQNAAK